MSSLYVSADGGRQPGKFNKYYLPYKVIKLQNDISVCNLEAIKQETVKDQTFTGTQKIMTSGCFIFLADFCFTDFLTISDKLTQTVYISTVLKHIVCLS